MTRGTEKRMKAFTEPMHGLAGFDQIAEDIAKRHTPVQIDGCIDAQKCHMIYSIGTAYPYKLIISYNEVRAREIFEEYKFFDKNVKLYPAKDTIFFNADIHSDLISGQRLSAIRPLMDGEPVTLITTVDGLQDSILPLDYLRSFCITLGEHDTVPVQALAARMVQLGYERTVQVEAPGQFSVRGGIFDFYNQSDDCPYRIELWDDEIDSIRSFDAQSQRSLERCGSVTIYPAAEYIFTEEIKARGLKNMDKDLSRQAAKLRELGKPESAARLEKLTAQFRDAMEISPQAANVDSYIGYFFRKGKPSGKNTSPALTNLLDYFGTDDSLVVIDEPLRIEERGKAVSQEYSAAMISRLDGGYVLPGQAAAVTDYRNLILRTAAMRTVMLSTLTPNRQIMPVAGKYSISVSGMKTYRGNFGQLAKDLAKWKSGGFRVILVCRSAMRGQQLVRELQDESLEAFYTEDMDHELLPRQIMVVRGNYRCGIEYPQIKFAIIAESDIFGEDKSRNSRRRKSAGSSGGLRALNDLAVGDYVVHERYGIGIYRGIEQIKIDGALKDHVKIEYADGGSLYVLASHLDSIQKYAAKDTENVKINKMTGREWGKTKTRVRKAVRELADDLVKLYAVRQARSGYECGPDTVWQSEFEQLFPYEETQDQLDAVEAVKKDMESRKIMDRLLCGDVGFGKTEVAIRAVFKMVQEGKQCAVLVPTTILAQQHFNTFTQRMKDYPIRIGLLSRFRTAKEVKQTLEDLSSGKLDVLIGTHRLLSKDVRFRDLGLLVVDEEQRFGVTHKEKIKKMRETVDVLTLTATPIPRTMHMSLIGIRDISLLEEAPVDRLPIQTYVMEFNEEMIREAVAREIARNGQVYYVYNRVQGIEEVAGMIKRLVPDAQVAFAHGRMTGRELEDIMYRFVNRDLDVLVSTTIVETGLDIPNVNTMIIQDADRFGLAQLYQLRGRVGRSGRTAYAFLMYRRDRMLRETAEKRLSAIREFTQLGSGYRIALRDLEIRGAGSLLGERQSGHIAQVGYDLYCKLLSEAVADAKGEERKEDFDTSVEIAVDAYLPDTYIRNESQKLDMYKHIADIRNEAEYRDILDEMIDRFGELPPPAEALLKIALMRAQAHDACITRIVQKDDRAVLHMLPSAPVNVAAISGLTAVFGQKVHFRADRDDPSFTLDMRRVGASRYLDQISIFIQEIVKLLF